MATAIIMNTNSNNDNFPNTNPLQLSSPPPPAATASTSRRKPVVLGVYRRDLKVSTSPVISAKKKRPLHAQQQDEEQAGVVSTASAALAALAIEESEPVAKKQRSSSSSSSSRCSTNQSTSKRRVRFGDVNIHTVSRIQEIDAPAVWYSYPEIVHSRYCDSYYVNFYATTAPNATSKTTTAVVGADEYRQDLFHALGAACGKVRPEARPLLALAQSDCRGLEREMTPCFRQRKKQVVANVLQSQAALKEYWTDYSSANSSDDMQQQKHKGAEILAAHCHKLALPATRFARLLAQGDALLVARERQQQQRQQQRS